MDEACCEPEGNVMILACSGGSNVEQTANRAAVELTQEGFAKMFCLAGIGVHLSGFIRSARDVPQMIAIDGCETGCTKAILGHAEIPVKGHLVLPGFGIEKNKDFILKKDEVQKVKEAIRKACSEST